ncbi:hypothetical protein RKD42_007908 [Streptomyces ambofaciens]
MPSWSRASTSSPVRSSNTANANMPRSRARQSVPQRRHASSTTSVSEVPRKRTPVESSSARSSGALYSSPLYVRASPSETIGWAPDPDRSTTASRRCPSCTSPSPAGWL